MANREDVDLSAYLAPKGKAPGIGSETGTTARDGISVYKSPHGSNRYLYSKQGAAVGVLQVVEISPGVAVIANVYTSPEWRRKGIATKLYERASKDFEVSLPERMSEAGLAWAGSVSEMNSNGVDWRSWFIPGSGWVSVPRGQDHRSVASQVTGVTDEEEARALLLKSGAVQSYKTWFQIGKNRKTQEILELLQDRVTEICEDAPVSCEGENVTLSLSDDDGQEADYYSWKLSQFMEASSWRELFAMRKNPEELEPNKRIQLNFEEANTAAQEILNKMFDSIDPYWLEAEKSKLGQLREYTLTDAFGGTVLPMKIRIGGLSVDVMLSAFDPRKPSVQSFNKGQASWKRRGRESVPTVEIELNGSHKVSHFKTWPAVREIEQVLRHELTHILDPKVMSGIKPSYSGGSTDAEYVNDSAEVKAFGNELAAWLRDALSRKGHNSIEDQDARMYADELLSEAMKAWPYKLMTESNKRRIRKDVYLYLAGEDS